MKGPPKHYPKNLDRYFAADPFDARMHQTGPTRDHTPLGLLIEIRHWYLEHEADCGPAFKPIINSIEDCLNRECPEMLQEMRAN